MPIIDTVVEGCVAKTLVDTGCAVTVVRSSVVGNCEGVSYMKAFDGSLVSCQGKRRINIEVRGRNIEVEAVV